jgi:hypothetical protein
MRIPARIPTVDIRIDAPFPNPYHALTDSARIDSRFQGVINHIWKSSQFCHNAGEIDFAYASICDASDCDPTFIYDYSSRQRFGTGPSRPDQFFAVRFRRMAVCPVAYALLSDFSIRGSNHLRCWVFEAREDDNIPWIALDERRLDPSLSGPGMHVLFPVALAARDPQWFREFRVRQTGPSSSGFLSFNLSGFEIHGAVQRDPVLGIAVNDFNNGLGGDE